MPFFSPETYEEVFLPIYKRLAKPALENGVPVSSGTTLFLRPKAFSFLPPRISVRTEEDDSSFRLTFTADVFVKSLCLGLKTRDAVFSDNWFDLHGPRAVTVTLPKTGGPAGLSAAYYLRLQGVASFLFEQMPEAGGLLRARQVH